MHNSSLDVPPLKLNIVLAISIRVTVYKLSKPLFCLSPARGVFLGVYGALGLSQALFVLFGAFALAVGAIRASRTLHNSMLANLLRSPMSFFDTTPLGRILNRFSKDIYTIDETVPRSLRAFLMTFFNVASTIIVILIATPIFAAIIVPLMFLYFFIQVGQTLPSLLCGRVLVEDKDICLAVGTINLHACMPVDLILTD